mgnify:CR=1 FL=1
MANDEILDELHRVREQLVAESGGDIAGLFRLLRSTARARGQETVTLSTKRACGEGPVLLEPVTSIR